MKPFPESCICKIVAKDQGKLKNIKVIRSTNTGSARCKEFKIKISWPSYWGSSTTNALKKILGRLLRHWPVLTKTIEEWGRKRKALTVKAIILWKSVTRMMRLLIPSPEKKNNSCYKYGNLNLKNPKIYQKKLINSRKIKLSKPAFSLRTTMVLRFTPLKLKILRKPLKISTAKPMSINFQSPSKEYV